MNKRFEAVDLDEPAELSFGEKKGAGGLSAMDMLMFDRLSAALTYAMETLHATHRSRCMITTRSGSIYHWDAIPTLYEHVRPARRR